MQDVSRYEKKYAVSQYEASLLHSTLGMIMATDIHSLGEEGYRVRSLYFDTPTNKDFYEKVDGLEERCKVRLRIYNPDDATAKLELKEKIGDLQRKRSVTLSRDQAEEVIAGNYDCLQEMDSSFAQFMYAYMTENLYRPKCVVEYKRLAFYAEGNEIRLTLDSELQATENSFDIFDTGLMLYPVGQLMSTVLEVKYNGFLFSYIKDALTLHNRMQVSESKYCSARMVLLSD